MVVSIRSFGHPQRLDDFWYPHDLGDLHTADLKRVEHLETMGLTTAQRRISSASTVLRASAMAKETLMCINYRAI